ncbi:putative toxin-antitoxin system toxin component, PIN family [Cyanobacterium aponinum UTEX 3222]|uniref:PIN domain-containing protein n=3 Tax=Cyanobacterium aponinum TaxID=379064 RepID=K9Z9R3_CYAAP|nr:putative toxin-antitoxin system toxin component, PIN family [Cyanobacterium aponinum]WRL42461.1 putative toxin-antitoxin system toxin component, PIN family [Cyanobacterium aponinum UTEX 3222]AFZ55462.1 protein of unknown function DUF132 [Cyanobacterium aponinum PCC 10605]MBD2392761.1 putative toxin-antitoxin system toxin component, PIN family [Cyanobacterium aponinum FACHB-4101]MTF40061.1 putative toxin-antitoxin system toxin component, PIN family [Cyanobacterium aponinum 0216]PHV63304.1 pu
MNKLRIILDTNILISGLLLSSSRVGEVFDIVTQNHILLISENTFTEFYLTITKRKFDKYLSFEKRIQFLGQLKAKALLINVIEIIDICRDSKDNKFLELAVSGKADFIVTGDNDLLVLNPFRDIEIITVSDFLNRFT